MNINSSTFKFWRHYIVGPKKKKGKGKLGVGVLSSVLGGSNSLVKINPRLC